MPRLPCLRYSLTPLVSGHLGNRVGFRPGGSLGGAWFEHTGKWRLAWKRVPAARIHLDGRDRGSAYHSG